MTTRRDFLKLSAGVGAGLGLSAVLPMTTADAVAPASPAGLTPYLDQLPTLVDNAVDCTRGGVVNLTATLVRRKVHSQLPATTLFGYVRKGGPSATAASASYLGPVLVAKQGTPVTVKYTNNLSDTAFQSVFGSDSSYTQWTVGHNGTRIQTHLHGGFVAGTDDGNPYATGPTTFGNTQTVHYPNEQPAALLWYHDHYMGATRMNVVAGLAGGYLLRDAFDTGANPHLPHGPYELPLAIQDRQFNADGSLLYPVNDPATLNGPWIPEYFGDVMLVNGKVWPYLNAEPAVYRFRVLNGCNARIMNLTLSSSSGQPVPMYIIGTEGGLLPDKPVRVDSLAMAPAERFDVLCDLTGFAGQSLLLQNIGFKDTDPISTPAEALRQVMQIRVSKKASPGALKTVIRSLPPADSNLRHLTALGAPRLSRGSVPGRMITLNEVDADGPNWTMNLNGVGYMDAEPNVQKLNEGDTEDWYYVNTTPDTHPMHTHLFPFKVIGRYNFNVAAFVAARGTSHGIPQQHVATLSGYLTSSLIDPRPEEAGFKDTVKANPGQVTVIRAQYRLPRTAHGTQKYVHHCHIVEHEDNDMMERFEVSQDNTNSGGGHNR